MKTLLEYLFGLAFGFGCAMVFDALGVNFYVGLVLTFVLLFLLVKYLEWQVQAASMEAARRQRSTIATSVREKLKTLDPPLPKEHYRTAFRRLCRAFAQGRKRVRIVAGEQTFVFNLQRI